MKMHNVVGNGTVSTGMRYLIGVLSIHLCFDNKCTFSKCTVCLKALQERGQKSLAYVPWPAAGEDPANMAECAICQGSTTEVEGRSNFRIGKRSTKQLQARQEKMVKWNARKARSRRVILDLEVYQTTLKDNTIMLLMLNKQGRLNKTSDYSSSLSYGNGIC